MIMGNATSFKANGVRELSAEEREMVFSEVNNVTTALDIERAVTAQTGNPAAGQMVRQLWFWDDKKKMCEDNWVFKSASEWQLEMGLSRGWVRSATRAVEDSGLVEVDRERLNPINRNRTTFYKLNVWAVAQLIAPAVLEKLEPELRHLDSDLADEDMRCQWCGDDLCDEELCLADEPTGSTNQPSGSTNRPSGETNHPSGPSNQPYIRRLRQESTSERTPGSLTPTSE